MKYDFSLPAAPAGMASIAWASVMDALDRSFPDLDAIILTSKDPFVSEYVPLSNNPRYGITGFTGSVGDAVYFTQKLRARIPGLKPVALFVDGRYHLQADRETPPQYVEVVKLEVEPHLESGIQKMLFESDRWGKDTFRVGLDYERTSVAAMARYQASAEKAQTPTQLYHVKGETVLSALKLKGWVVDREIKSLPERSTGRSIQRTLEALVADLKKNYQTDQCIHVTATTDDAAFLLNARGYHLPHTASVMAYTFFYQRELVVFLPSSSKDCPVQLDASTFGDFSVTVIRDSWSELEAKLKALATPQWIVFNGAAMNAMLPSRLSQWFPRAKIDAQYSWVLRTRCQKTHQEMDSIRRAFLKSSKAIAKTLRWGKTESQNRAVSEVDLAQTLYQNYLDEGAVALSFKTISGAGPNSAIVHYNTPGADQIFKPGMLALLDSGAYYDDGFCTDCTRGFFVGGNGSAKKPEPWQIDIYTTTLKAAIQVFLKPVLAQWSGKEVDAQIRGIVKAAGYDYLHGTGHGIGIHVHEEGIRLSTLSIYPQSPFACVSVEPGIYIEGKGGVRVENVALLQPLGKAEGPQFEYENVVFVGYDWDLIDLKRLNKEEKSYLKAYEAKCSELGTQLTACPL